MAPDRPDTDPQGVPVARLDERVKTLEHWFPKLTGRVEENRKGIVDMRIEHAKATRFWGLVQLGVSAVIGLGLVVAVKLIVGGG